MPMRHASKTEPDTEPAAARRVSVLLPLPLGTAYDYRLPADMTLTPGDFVSVPLGRRTVVTALVIREYFVQPTLVRNAL